MNKMERFSRGEGPATGTTTTGASTHLPIPTLNPMMMEVILKILFDVCDPTDLPQFRLVCSLWHKASLDAWRSTAPVVIIIRSPENRVRFRRGININLLLMMAPYLRPSAPPTNDDNDGHSAQSSRGTSGIYVRLPSWTPGREEMTLEQFLSSITKDTTTTTTTTVNSGVAPSMAPPPPPPHNRPFSSFRLIRWLISNPAQPMPTEDDAPPNQLGVAHIGGINNNNNNDLAQKQEEFWRVCGHQIRRLHLDQMIWPGSHSEPLRLPIESFKDLIFVATPNVVKLKVEGLQPRRGTQYWNVQEGANLEQPQPPPARRPPQRKLESLELVNLDSWHVPWRDTLFGFPNMQSLMLHGVSPRVLDGMLAAAAALRAEADSGHQQRLELKSLEVDFLPHHAYADKYVQLSHDTANLFREARLPLESLKIELGNASEGPVVRQVVQSAAATLRKLHCIRTMLRADDARLSAHLEPLLDEPLEHLTDLRLNGPIAPNFGFLEYTPSLETLHLDYYYYCGKGEFESHRRGNPLITKATQVKVENPFRPEFGRELATLIEFKTGLLLSDEPSAFLNISQWMPNLTRLAAPLTSVTFPMVCSAWKSTLQELHVTKEGNIGDDITGLGVVRGPEENIHIPPPNITDLKELHKFSVDKLGQCRFTEMTVWTGFIPLPKLKTLQIILDKELSPSVLAVLNKRNIDISLTTWVGRRRTDEPGVF